MTGRAGVGFAERVKVGFLRPVTLTLDVSLEVVTGRRGHRHDPRTGPAR
jgi:hypothetical protein